MIVAGDVVLEEPTHLADATVRVALQDVSMADAPARVIAWSERVVSGRAMRTITFRIEVPRVPLAGRRYVLAAEIRAAGHAEVESNDFLNTTTVPWTPREPDHVRWRIPVRRI